MPHGGKAKKELNKIYKYPVKFSFTSHVDDRQIFMLDIYFIKLKCSTKIIPITTEKNLYEVSRAMFSIIRIRHIYGNKVFCMIPGIALW